MKKFLTLLFIFFFAITNAQSTKFHAFSYNSIEMVDGKKSYTKPEKVDITITIDTENKQITFSGTKERSLRIIKFYSHESYSGGNKVYKYDTLDEKGIGCTVSRSVIAMAHGGTEQNLYFEHDNINDVYKIEPLD